MKIFPSLSLWLFFFCSPLFSSARFFAFFSPQYFFYFLFSLNFTCIYHTKKSASSSLSYVSSFHGCSLSLAPLRHTLRTVHCGYHETRDREGKNDIPVSIKFSSSQKFQWKMQNSRKYPFLCFFPLCSSFVNSNVLAPSSRTERRIIMWKNCIIPHKATTAIDIHNNTSRKKCEPSIRLLTLSSCFSLYLFTFVCFRSQCEKSVKLFYPSHPHHLRLVLTPAISFEATAIVKPKEKVIHAFFRLIHVLQKENRRRMKKCRESFYMKIFGWMENFVLFYLASAAIIITRLLEKIFS